MTRNKPYAKETLETRKRELNAFVIMPFEPPFDKIFDELIRPALEEVGYAVKRADSFIGHENILKDIVRGIAEADLVVADLSTLNSNVLYELGISHSLKKPTVILTQSIEEVPFDLRSYRVIRYSTHFAEVDKLSNQLKDIGKKVKTGKWLFSNPIIDFLPKPIKSPEEV